METLEKLSNNEIRFKCIEHGLPNVPVTDSSRKLLIKRLNDAINNTAPKESTKAANRRETINIAKAAPPPEVETQQKSRRTISAATLASTKEDNAPTAIPIATRRRSVQKDVTETSKPTKDFKPIDSILIEDDEDDVELINAADAAEHINAAERASTTSSVPIENITGRRKSRSVSVPKVTETIVAAKKRVMTPLLEDKVEVEQQQSVTKTVKPQAASNQKVVNIISVQKLPTIESPIALTQQPITKANVEYFSHYSMQNTTPSVYSTPSSMRYTLGAGLSTTASTATVGGGGGYLGSSQSAYRSKYLTEFNELSDTDVTNDDGGCKSPFLSNFARDLERRRSVGRTTTGSGYGQYVRRNSYEKTAIRGRRSSKADLSMGQIALVLGRKYHVKTIFFLLVLICIAIFIYVYLYA